MDIKNIEIGLRTKELWLIEVRSVLELRLVREAYPLSMQHVVLRLIAGDLQVRRVYSGLRGAYSKQLKTLISKVLPLFKLIMPLEPCLLSASIPPKP